MHCIFKPDHMKVALFSLSRELNITEWAWGKIWGRRKCRSHANRMWVVFTVMSNEYMMDKKKVTYLQKCLSQ